MHTGSTGQAGSWPPRGHCMSMVDDVLVLRFDEQVGEVLDPFDLDYGSWGIAAVLAGVTVAAAVAVLSSRLGLASSVKLFCRNVSR